MFSEGRRPESQYNQYEESKHRVDTPSDDTDKFNPLESRDGSYIIDLTTKMKSPHKDDPNIELKEFTPIREDSEAEQISSFPSSF